MAEQPTLGRMGQQFTDPLDSLLRCATMLWNHDSSLRVVWILFFSPYSSGTLFATPFSIVTLLFALCEPCLKNHSQECARAFVLGMVKDLLGCSFLHNHGLIHKDHVVGYIAGKTHLVCDYHHGHPFFSKLAHYFEYFTH